MLTVVGKTQFQSQRFLLDAVLDVKHHSVSHHILIHQCHPVFVRAGKSGTLGGELAEGLMGVFAVVL